MWVLIQENAIKRIVQSFLIECRKHTKAGWPAAKILYSCYIDLVHIKLLFILYCWRMCMSLNYVQWYELVSGLCCFWTCERECLELIPSSWVIEKLYSFNIDSLNRKYASCSCIRLCIYHSVQHNVINVGVMTNMNSENVYVLDTLRWHTTYKCCKICE